MRHSLKVILWGEEIGRLSWHAPRRTTFFEFSPSGGKYDIAPLIAPLDSPTRKLPHYGIAGKTYQGLPPFLSDSLPDSWGNELFEQWRIANRMPKSQETPLEKLSFIGQRGMGALEYEPSDGKMLHGDTIDIKSLIDMARRIFTEREDAHILPGEEITRQALIAVGTSAGGRQPKAIVAIDRETGDIRSGQIGGLQGYDYCIIKFGDPARSSAELEMAYYRMALEAGITMTRSEVLTVEDERHFLTERFDRREGGKLHVQTLAAMWPEADSYEGLLDVCRRLRLPDSVAEEVLRRLVFNVLANNTDDHSKNFSFIMDRQGNWSLSPAYDMTFIFNEGGFLPQESRCLMVNGKTEDITCGDVVRFAADAGIKRASAIIKEVGEALLHFREIAVEEHVQPEWIGRVEAVLTARLAEWGLITPPRSEFSFTYGGHAVEHARITPQYRGNFKLEATVDGIAHTRIIRRGSDEFARIAGKGTANLTDADVCALTAEFTAGEAGRAH